MSNEHEDNREPNASMSREELDELARERGVDVSDAKNKGEIVSRLRGGRRGGPKSKGADNSGEGDGGAAEVTERMHEEQRQGYVGTVPDETPNEAYTLQGQGKGNTPEEDEGIAHQPS